MGRQKLSKFLYQEPLPDFEQSSQDEALDEPCTATVSNLRDLRDRFVKKIALSEKNDPCNMWDRAATLAVISEAISIAHKVKNPAQLYSEVIMKMGIILGVGKAQPTDFVFTNKMLLKPLEPQYAIPRIDAAKDGYGYRADWRLQAWRRNGWPDAYPDKAVREERDGKPLMRMKDSELLESMEKLPAEDWGDEVNATGWPHNQPT